MTKITRRTLLRGTLAGSAIALGLPVLECMGVGRGEAWAQSVNPVGFGIFFWGGGLPHSTRNDAQSEDADRYTPALPAGGAGSVALQLSELLRPLASVRDHLNVVTGMNTSRHRVTQRESHFNGQCIALTGDGVAYIDRSDLLYSYARPSLDRLIAGDPKFYPEPPRRGSVQMSAIRDFFKRHSGWNCVSMDGQDQPVNPMLDPRALYDYLFAGLAAPGSDRTQQNFQSALDAVTADAKALQAKLGALDRQRLERHLDGLRSIERQLEAAPLVCSAPAAPEAEAAKVLPTFDLQAEILVAALRCDITRVFSFMVSSGAHGLKIDAQGVQDGPGSSANHGRLHAGDNGSAGGNALFTFTALERLLARLSAEESPTGATLLDNMLIYATSEYGSGWHHKHDEFPVILAGKAGGRLRTGNHVRVPNGNICDVQLTILQALGLDYATFGFRGGETTQTLPGLLV